jgi:catechol 2,3-dioxygenase-like lactoylglutathione lyase family enzyme
MHGISTTAGRHETGARCSVTDKRRHMKRAICGAALAIGVAMAPATAAWGADGAQDNVAAATAVGHFSFTKLIVQDLDAAAAFFRKVCGMTEKHRIGGAADGHENQEIVLNGTAEGQPTLVLFKRADRTLAATDEVVLGFITPDVAAFVDRAIAAGGKVIQPVKSYASQGISMAIVADPEGHLIEAIEMTAK